MSRRSADLNIVTETREINGFAVTCKQLPVVRSLKLMAKVANIAMPIMGQLAPFLEPDGEGGVRLKPVDMDKLAVPMASIFAKVGEDNIQSLMRDLLMSTSVMIELDDGQRALKQLDSDDMINMVFGGDLKTLLMVMGFSLQVNFRSFFPAGGPSAAKGTKPKVNP